MPIKDPDKRKESNLRAVKRYNQKNREAKNEYHRERERSNRTFLAEYKAELGCADCGIKIPEVLQFHHIDRSTKEFTISNNCRMGLDRLLREAAKCIVLCSNCHIIRHAKERRIYDGSFDS